MLETAAYSTSVGPPVSARPCRAAIGAFIDAVAVARGKNGLRHPADHAADGRVEQDAGDAFATAASGIALTLLQVLPPLVVTNMPFEGADIDDIGIVGIDGHLLANHAVAVVGRIADC